MSLFSWTPEQLADQLGGPGRARAVFSMLRRGEDPYAALEPGALSRLRRAAPPTQVELDASTVASDGTRKLRVRLEDGRAIECVLIPERDRTTLCVSTQVGCARDCQFCLTGSMGLLRNLSCEEIVAQAVLAIRTVRDTGMPQLRNLVFMGMGEPLDNSDSVERALSVLTRNDALGFGPRHVTVSTVGTNPQAIERAAAWPGRLAWSLHAAEDARRRQIVPTARHSTRALFDAFERGLVAAGKHSLFVEVTLMRGVNDAPEDADAILELFAHTELEVRINLLPMNAGNNRGLVAAPIERVQAFRSQLQAGGLFCSLRPARGADEGSACGQLVVELSA